MRRSSCPSVKRARLELDSDSTNSFPSDADRIRSPSDRAKALPREREIEKTTDKSDSENERTRRQRSIEAGKEDRPKPTASDYLSTVAELESKNADKISELKLILRASQMSDDPSQGNRKNGFEERGYYRDNDDDDDERRERLLEELRGWEEAEKDLDDEIARSKKNGDDVHIEKLHEYNDLKDACQAVFGRLAELEEVTVSDIYKRYDVNVDD